ncbi:MAG: copper-translocating P-type ATPase [Clostridia bacterium]|nr:copper-translocating P-type ATPase [Clostridia bacterium]
MKAKFNVEGMMCAACSAAVERAVSKLDGVESAQVNLLAKLLTAEFDENITDITAITEAVKKAGFTAEHIDEKPDINPETEPQKAKFSAETTEKFTPVKTRLAVSVPLLAILMYITMGHMVGLPLPHFLHGTENAVSYAFLQFLLTLPIVYVNRKFFFGGFSAIRRKAPNMDTLVAVGSGAALIYGVISIFMIGYGLGNSRIDIAEKYVSNLYFESAATILTLVTVGKFLEERSKRKTNKAVEKLIDLSPKTATVLRNGKEITVKADEIHIGDTLVIRPGEKIPVDGTVTEGSSNVDQSALTGESMPVAKSEGDTVMSASINLEGAFYMKATKVGKDTTLAQIIELVENAGASKAPAARLADKIAGIFVPAVMCISLITFIGWMIAGQSLEFSLSCAICVLVISCPCALGLATPVAITVSAGKCASQGILVKSAAALETLGKADVFVLDKTGTVTTGKPAVTDIITYSVDKDELLMLAASIEKTSEHPIAKAICENYNGNTAKATDFTYTSGMGVSADINGKRIIGGNSALMKINRIDISPALDEAAKLSSQGKTPVFFACNYELCGIIAVADEIKPTSTQAIKALKSKGAEVILLTGDNKNTAEAIGITADVSYTVSDVMPADKSEFVKQLQKQGKTVVMVGDGINDSPALTQSDVGIAIGNGTDIAIESADIILMKSDLNDVVRASSFSRKTLKNIRQNLFWAFFYNVIGIPIAAGLLFPFFGITLSPMIGAAAMSLSSVFVVTNALRLYGMK